MKCPKCSYDAPKLAIRCPKCMAPLPKAEAASKAPAKPPKPPPEFPISAGTLAIGGAVIIALGSILILRNQEAKKTALERQRAAAEAAQREEQARVEKEKLRQAEIQRLKAQMEEDARNAAQPMTAWGEGIPAFPGAKPAAGAKGPPRENQGTNPPLPPAIDPAQQPPEVWQDLRKAILKETSAEQQKGNP